jgi:hypothetical protein
VPEREGGRGVTEGRKGERKRRSEREEGGREGGRREGEGEGEGEGEREGEGEGERERERSGPALHHAATDQQPVACTHAHTRTRTPRRAPGL